MKVFSIFGYSNSGKTTTVECLIAELCARGYSVASVKDIHFEQFTIDTAGSDTNRHRRAGAGLVTALGLSETDILFQERMPIDFVLGIYREYGHFDYVVLEGTGGFTGPGIVTASSLAELEKKWDENRIAVFAIAGKIASEITSHRGVPSFDARMRAKDLVNLIETAVPEWENPLKNTANMIE